MKKNGVPGDTQIFVVAEQTYNYARKVEFEGRTVWITDERR